MQLARFIKCIAYHFLVNIYSSCQDMAIDNYSMDEKPLQDISMQENDTDDSYSASSCSFSDSDDSENLV